MLIARLPGLIRYQNWQSCKKLPPVVSRMRVLTTVAQESRSKSARHRTGLRRVGLQACAWPLAEGRSHGKHAAASGSSEPVPSSIRDHLEAGRGERPVRRPGGGGKQRGWQRCQQAAQRSAGPGRTRWTRMASQSATALETLNSMVAAPRHPESPSSLSLGNGLGSSLPSIGLRSLSASGLPHMGSFGGSVSLVSIGCPSPISETFSA